jgi:hypothetical protein
MVTFPARVASAWGRFFPVRAAGRGLPRLREMTGKRGDARDVLAQGMRAGDA